MGKRLSLALSLCLLLYLYVWACVHMCACAGDGVCVGMQYMCTGVARLEINLGCRLSDTVHLGF